ncbi:DUF2934 domain-containing protein [Puniceibacterium sp. IMCC21224]|uniref:DUF2934 domain-containing protein n=1 Tax=Puniceibacterium sp. IMCC21224 TaxID=1618204 RepID=UPI00064DA196|nr:DUF2934 domain-containing protein [Puniceibacterium sp. IMCC21224]KMK67720.1 Protein of unknown function (DUF2934) [Puniceibacterium sp. IMCC21224]
MATPDIDDAKIAEAAFYIWQDEGQPSGRAQEHWAQAQAALVSAKKRAKTTKPRAKSATPKKPRAAAKTDTPAKAATKPAAKSKPTLRARKTTE